MNLDEWRARRTASCQLPSGLQVTLRYISLQTLMSTGRIPKPALGIIAESASQNELDLSDLDSIVRNFDKLPALADMLNAVVKAVLVDPPCADVADDNHISVDELEFADRLFIFDFVNKGVMSVAPFPEEQAGT